MTPAEATARPARTQFRAWPVWTLPARLRCYVLGVEVVAAIACLWAVATLHPSMGALLRAVLLLGLTIAFEEGVSRASRLRIKLSEELKPDMASVWAGCAIIVLPPGYLVGCIATILIYFWVRQQRPAGEQAFRKVSTASMALVAALAGHHAMVYVDSQVRALPEAFVHTFPFLVALVVFTVINRALVTGALHLAGVTGKALLGSREDNLVELASLCLGGLAALAMLHQPVLTVLVLLPMVLLQRTALVHQLEHAATTDAKTGLLNAIAWEQLARRELARGDRTHSTVAVLILDIDKFKVVNDTHGHLAGDAVLKGIATRLSTELRGYDIVGRFGGEEFVAMVPIGTEEQAMNVAERLRQGINELHVSDLVELSDPTLDSVLAVSIGVACAPTDGDDLTDLLHAADSALYTAKNTGRNRVVLAQRGGGRGRMPTEVG